MLHAVHPSASISHFSNFSITKSLLRTAYGESSRESVACGVAVYDGAKEAIEKAWDRLKRLIDTQTTE